MLKQITLTLLLACVAPHTQQILAEEAIYSDSLRGEDFENIPSMNKNFIESQNPTSEKKYVRKHATIGDNIGDAIREGAENIVGNIKDNASEMLDSITKSPMLVNCFMSPTKCAVTKDARRHGTMVAAMMENKIRDLDKYLSEGGRVLKETFAQCITGKLDHGTSKTKAFNACDAQINQKGSILNFATGKLADSHQGVLEDSLDWANVPNNPETKHIINLMKSFLGDLVVEKVGSEKGVTIDLKNNYGKSLDNELFTTSQPLRHALKPSEYLFKLQTFYRKQICSPILKEGNAFLSNTRKISLLVKKLNIGAASGVFHPDILRSFTDIEPSQRRGECNHLANSYARLRFSRESNQIRDLAMQSLKNPHLSESTKSIIQNRLDLFTGSSQDQIKFFDREDEILGKNLASLKRRSTRQKEDKAKISYRKKGMRRTQQRMQKSLGRCSIDTGDGCI